MTLMLKDNISILQRISLFALCAMVLIFGQATSVVASVQLQLTKLANVKLIESHDSKIVAIKHLPLTNKPVLVAHQNGKISVSYLEDKSNSVPQLLLDLSVNKADSFVASQFHLGVYGLALHPNFNQKDSPGYRSFFTAHSEKASATFPTSFPVINKDIDNIHHYDVVSQWFLDTSTQPWQITTNTRDVIRIARRNASQKIIAIKFRPNSKQWMPDFGNLYIALDDVNELKPNALHSDIDGSILRISASKFGLNPYRIPDDNPYVDGGKFIPETYISGLKHIRGFTWDTSGKEQLIIADHVDESLQEIDIGFVGADYGRGLQIDTENFTREQHREYDKLARMVESASANYPQEIGEDIVSGEVYRGRTLYQLIGFYIFADKTASSLLYVPSRQLKSGRISDISTLPVEGYEQLLHRDTFHALISQDKQGELYFTHKTAGDLFTLTEIMPVIEPSTEGQQSAAATDQEQSSNSTLVIVLTGALFALVIFYYFRRKNNLRQRLLSYLNQHYTEVEWHENTQTLAFSNSHNQKKNKTVAVKDIDEVNVLLNLQSILLINAEKQHCFTMDAEHEVSHIIQQEHINKMMPDKVRGISLQFTTVENETLIVALYLRKGSQRLTRLSFKKACDEMINWCWLISKKMNPEGTGKRIIRTKPEVVKNPTVAATTKYGQPSNPTGLAQEKTEKLDSIDQQKPAPAQTKHAATPENSASAPSSSIVAELEKLVQLKQQGLITEQEFAAAKQKLLNS